MIKEAWDALRAAILLDSELKRQREDILRALSIIRELAAENAALRGRLMRLEKAHTAMQKEVREKLLKELRELPPPSDQPTSQHIN